jgi:hypothetical protein
MKIRAHLFFLVFAALLPILLFSVALTALFWHEQRSALEQRIWDRVQAMSIALDRELDGDIRVL